MTNNLFEEIMAVVDDREALKSKLAELEEEIKIKNGAIKMYQKTISNIVYNNNVKYGDNMIEVTPDQFATIQIGVVDEASERSELEKFDDDPIVISWRCIKCKIARFSESEFVFMKGLVNAYKEWLDVID